MQTHTPRPSRFLSISIFTIGVACLSTTAFWFLVGKGLLSTVVDTGYPLIRLTAIASDEIRVEEPLRLTYQVQNVGDVTAFSVYLLIHTPPNTHFESVLSGGLCQDYGDSVVCSAGHEADRGFVLMPGESRRFSVAFAIENPMCGSSIDVDASALVVSPAVINGFENHDVTTVGVTCEYIGDEEFFALPILDYCATHVKDVCGDGCLAPQEECDDRNRVSNDGCTQCQIDPQSVCSGEPSVCYHEVYPSINTPGFHQAPTWGNQGYGPLPENTIVLDDEQGIYVTENRRKFSGGYGGFYSQLRGSPVQSAENKTNWPPVTLRGDYDVYVTWNPKEVSYSPVLLQLRMTAVDSEGNEFGDYMNARFTELKDLYPNGPSWGGQLWERVGSFHIESGGDSVKASLEYIGGRGWKNWWYTIDAIALVKAPY